MESFQTSQADAFELRLTISMSCLALWVLLAIIPAVMDNIRLPPHGRVWNVLSPLFSIVHGALAGPAFLVIFDALLSTFDCQEEENADYTHGAVNGSEWLSGNFATGKFYMAGLTTQACWKTKHFIYATMGLTGLTAYVPLVALKPGEYHDAVDIRFTHLYFRIELLAKGLMVFIMHNTGTGGLTVSCLIVALIAGAMVSIREKQIGGSGGSFEPPGPLLTHLHTVYMVYSECLPSYPLDPPG
jgi:hypothetical protein